MTLLTYASQSRSLLHIKILHPIVSEPEETFCRHLTAQGPWVKTTSALKSCGVKMHSHKKIVRYQLQIC